jgi:hypothetical protein
MKRRLIITFSVVAESLCLVGAGRADHRPYLYPKNELVAVTKLRREPVRPRLAGYRRQLDRKRDQPGEEATEEEIDQLQRKSASTLRMSSDEDLYRDNVI